MHLSMTVQSYSRLWDQNCRHHKHKSINIIRHWWSRCSYHAARDPPTSFAGQFEQGWKSLYTSKRHPSPLREGSYVCCIRSLDVISLASLALLALVGWIRSIGSLIHVAFSFVKYWIAVGPFWWLILCARSLDGNFSQFLPLPNRKNPP